jgi:hypothetical protein
MKNFWQVTAAAFAVGLFVFSAHGAMAQYGGNVYGGYGNSAYGGYGGAGYGGYYGGYGGAGYGGYYGGTGFRNPLTYGGYGNRFTRPYTYQPTFIYKSPASLSSSRANDPYHRTNLNSLEESMRRFQDLREDSRSEDQYYSNEIYKQNHPFDEFYYERMMTP